MKAATGSWVQVLPLLLAGATALVAARPARAQAPTPASFALIIGVNHSPDPAVLPLRYADDDAARYRDLFQTMGARTFLLSTLDENTRRLHPEAAAEAVPARLSQLSAAVAAIATEVERAHQAGRTASLHVFYAGHGGEEGRAGYVALEDQRLTGQDLLREVFDRIGADRKHLVVDACNAYLLVLGRGEGGQRRPLQGFTRSDAAMTLLNRLEIGLLLSTSSARESHEWAGFQAGVFSHEVRSGMFGAADANGDGVIAYTEMRAFIQRANESIPNERYRPEIFWRAPRAGDELVDIRTALARRVEVPAAQAGHHYLEDPRGVRLADFHNGKSLNVHLLRPQKASHLYLQRTWDGREYLLPGSEAVVRTAGLTAQEPHVGVRNAANEAFQVLFALPFDGTGARTLAGPEPGLQPTVTAAPLTTPLVDQTGQGWGPQRIVGWGLVVGSAMAAAVSAELFVSARSLQSASGEAHQTPAGAAQRSEDVRSYQQFATISAGVAGLAAVAGGLVLLWPETPVQAMAATDGAMMSWRGRF